MRFYFQARLLDPVIVSENSNTSNPETLDYIPGSSILGIVASKLYPKLEKTEAWQYFQNADVRFGPCYLEQNKEIALPIPASWHYPKLEKDLVKVEKHYQASILCNHSQGDVNQSVQYKQCRSGFVTSKGYSAEVQTGQITKTALDRSTGGVAQSQLFIYQYLQAEQNFIGWVECQTEAQKTQIQAVLFGEQRIGHARSSEFGRVWISPVDIKEPALPKVEQKKLTLWCLSDAQCFNSFGLPTFTPNLAELVEGAFGELDFSKSFIRQSKISRFNQKRGGLDGEQLCIAKGSVLVFKNVSIDDQQITALSEQGIGINRQQGLGLVMLEPSWMQGFSDGKAWFSAFENTSTEITQPPQLKIQIPETQGLQAWLERKAETKDFSMKTEENAQVIINELLDAYSTLRDFNRISTRENAGPSSSQWARVVNVLRDLSGKTDIDKDHGKLWRDRLFIGDLSAKDPAICKAKNDERGWGIEWRTKNGDYLSAASFCERLLAPYRAADLLKALEILNRYDLSQWSSLQLAQKEQKQKEPKA